LHFAATLLNLQLVANTDSNHPGGPRWIPILPGVDLLTDAPLLPGTKVRLPDGSIAWATADRRVGYTWDGTYRTVQPNGNGGWRFELGWRRDQLQELP